MNKAIIGNINKVAEFENPARAKRQKASHEQPTAANVVLAGSGDNFSAALACLLRVLGGLRDFA